jgi:hypothetical protein
MDEGSDLLGDVMLSYSATGGKMIPLRQLNNVRQYLMSLSCSLDHKPLVSLTILKLDNHIGHPVLSAEREGSITTG